MFCMVCNLHFVSKSWVLAETGSAKSLYEYAGPFFLLGLFPIGVWYLQPRINRLDAERARDQPAIGPSAREAASAAASDTQAFSLRPRQSSVQSPTGYSIEINKVG